MGRFALCPCYGPLVPFKFFTFHARRQGHNFANLLSNLLSACLLLSQSHRELEICCARRAMPHAHMVILLSLTDGFRLGLGKIGKQRKLRAARGLGITVVG